MKMHGSDIKQNENLESTLISTTMLNEMTNAQTSERIIIENNFFRTLIDQLPDRIFCKDKECRFLINNKAHLKALGNKTQQEVIGKTDFDFRPKEVAAKFYNDDMIVIQTGKSFEDIEELTVDNNGNESWRLVTKAPLFDLENNVIGLTGISRDITQRKQNLEAIQKQNEELKLLNAEKDQLFSIIAHDLRSPFQGFIGLSEVLSKEYHSFSIKQLQAMSDELFHSAINLYKLLENLLEWSNVKRGGVKFNPQLINLSNILKANIELLSPRLNLKDIKIEADFSDNIEIFADQKMIESVIRNLISNAIKFTDKGGKITVYLNDEFTDYVEVFVKDTGVGIPPDVLTKLFKIGEKVTRVGTDGEPSTGLGLFLCDEFINKHNGSIQVESEVDRGTTFSFRLPKVVMKINEQGIEDSIKN
ncbi:MAG: PAS domain-containing sensor histidine kinase [Ignavibacteria bacterium]|nr:PAS domain-containing sensor histidine kinase [Ignavibacteria bacterium]